MATADVQKILHALAERVRLHSEPEAEGIHDAIDALDPDWTKPKPVTAPPQVLTGPDGQPVSPQLWATFLATQAAEDAKARAAELAALQPETPAPGSPVAAAMTPADVAALAAAHGLTVVPTGTEADPTGASGAPTGTSEAPSPTDEGAGTAIPQ